MVSNGNVSLHNLNCKSLSPIPYGLSLPPPTLSHTLTLSPIPYSLTFIDTHTLIPPLSPSPSPTPSPTTYCLSLKFSFFLSTLSLPSLTLTLSPIPYSLSHSPIL